MTTTEYTAEDIAAYKVWCDAEFARGVCPWSGLDVHSCHRGVCDCFDADGCRSCGSEVRTWSCCECCRGRSCRTPDRHRSPCDLCPSSNPGGQTGQPQADITVARVGRPHCSADHQCDGENYWCDDCEARERAKS